MFSHPLDPITVTELSSAVRILRAHFNGQRLRFKFIDLLECAKADVTPYLEAERLGQTLPPAPDRRAKVYFHRIRTEVFQKAIVNVTTGVVESLQELPDAQGPVDYDEFEQIEKICNSHPEVLKEVAKLKLPAGYVLPHQ
jgi:primary-amine oxidase